MYHVGDRPISRSGEDGILNVMSDCYHGQLWYTTLYKTEYLLFLASILLRMAANPLPLTPLQDLFDNVMSLNLAQRTCLHNVDIFTLDDLLDLSPKEMSEWANRKSGLTAARGGWRWGIAATKKL